MCPLASLSRFDVLTTFNVTSIQHAPGSTDVTAPGTLFTVMIELFDANKLKIGVGQYTRLVIVSKQPLAFLFAPFSSLEALTLAGPPCLC